MSLIKPKNTYYFKSKNAHDDIKKLIHLMHLRNRNHFSNIIIGHNALIFENNILKTAFSQFEKFTGLSSVKVVFEAYKSYIAVRTEISFITWSLFYVSILLSALFFFIIKAKGSIEFYSLVSIVGLSLLIIFPMLSTNTFGSEIIHCAKECGMGINTEQFASQEPPKPAP